MAKQDTQSQLSMMSPLQKPDCAKLLNDIKDNHFTRYVWYPGTTADDWTTRKVPQPGQKPPLPWPNAANLKVRLTDVVVNDWRDLLTVAEARTPVSIVPSDLDMDNDDRMTKAAGWGTIYDYYSEQAELELHRARSGWKDIAWEYGHSIMFIGWRQEKQLQKRTLDAETVINLLAYLQVQEAQEAGIQITPSALLRRFARAIRLITAFLSPSTKCRM